MTDCSARFIRLRDGPSQCPPIPAACLRTESQQQEGCIKLSAVICRDAGYTHAKPTQAIIAEMVNVQNVPTFSSKGMTAGARAAVVTARRPLRESMSTCSHPSRKEHLRVRGHYLCTTLPHGVDAIGTDGTQNHVQL
jgi:hypothetical protein